MVEFKARKKNKEVELSEVLYWFCNSPSSGHPWFHCNKTPRASSTDALRDFFLVPLILVEFFFCSQPLGKKNGSENIGFSAQYQKLLRSSCYWWESLCRNSLSLHAFLRIQTVIITECCDSKIIRSEAHFCM